MERQFGTKMHQNAFGGCPPGPAKELQRSPDPLAEAKAGEGERRDSREREVKEDRDKKERAKRGGVREGEGMEGGN